MAQITRIHTHATIIKTTIILLLTKNNNNNFKYIFIVANIFSFNFNFSCIFIEDEEELKLCFNWISNIFLFFFISWVFSFYLNKNSKKNCTWHIFKSSKISRINRRNGVAGRAGVEMPRINKNNNSPQQRWTRIFVYLFFKIIDFKRVLLLVSLFQWCCWFLFYSNCRPNQCQLIFSESICAFNNCHILI